MNSLMRFLICLLAGAMHCALLPAQVSLPAIPDTIALIGGDFINTPLNERDMALSPDGKEIYYTVVSPLNSISAILVSVTDNTGKWSKPAVVSFSGHYSDLEPAFTADGKRMFFASNRPVAGSGVKDFDIWMVDRMPGGEWGTPANIGAPVNTKQDEFYPSLATNGNLYFTAAYAGSKGKEDIYFARWLQDKYDQPVSLDTAINSDKYEFNAFVSPDESFIIFTSYGRKDDKGRGDLYISRKDAQGNWKPCKNMEAINSAYLDYCPYVSPDRKIFFFTSERGDLPSEVLDRRLRYDDFGKMFNGVRNGNGNIYWVKWERVK